MARWLPKVQQIKELGYLVIEFPDYARNIGQSVLYTNDPQADPDDAAGWCRNKEDLRKTTKTVIDVLAGKRSGRYGRIGGYFKRGLLRWHWFGDKVEGKYNPHLNIIVDAGYLDKGQLEAIKTSLRQALQLPDLIVNYSYTDKPGKMLHTIHYIQRATFKKLEWSPYMANELYNFRNNRWWGDWKQPVVWDSKEAGELTDIVHLQSGRCPVCGLSLKLVKMNGNIPVRWSKPIDARYLDTCHAAPIGNTGYYEIPDDTWHKSGVDKGTGEEYGVLSFADMYRLSSLESESKRERSIITRLKQYAAYKLSRMQYDDGYWNSVLSEN